MCAVSRDGSSTRCIEKERCLPAGRLGYRHAPTVAVCRNGKVIRAYVVALPVEVDRYVLPGVALIPCWCALEYVVAG